MTLAYHSLSGNKGNITSTTDFEDYAGQKRSMRDGSGFSGINADLILNYKNLETAFSYGNYQYDNISNLGIVGLGDNVILNRSFDNFLSSIKYKIEIGDNLTITPKFNYSYYIPYNLSGKKGNETIVPNGDIYKLNTSRMQGNIEAIYNYNENLNVIVGVEKTYLTAKAETRYIPFAVQLGNLANIYFDGNDNIDMNSFATYTQLDFYNDIVNITAGLRYDKHNLAGSAIVPRIALTKKIDKFHVKLLYSEAYRLPDIVNITSAVKIDENNDVQTDENGVPIKGELTPEKIHSSELEAGYQLTSFLSLSMNIFRSQINNPVMYRFIDGYDTYSNFGKISTEGLETSILFKNKFGHLKCNFSFYKVNKNTISFFEVDDKDDILLGFPTQKISLYGSIKLFENLYISPTIHYYSKRYTAYREEGKTLLSKELDPIFIANLFIRYEINNNFEIGAGVYDILDSKFSYIPETESYHTPLPTRNREFLIKIKYEF